VSPMSYFNRNLLRMRITVSIWVGGYNQEKSAGNMFTGLSKVLGVAADESWWRRAVVVE
jgi:hypothetical protein